MKSEKQFVPIRVIRLNSLLENFICKLNIITIPKTKYNKFSRRFITVDAYAAAIPFYLKNGFVPLNDEDADEPTRLLYFDLNDLDEE